MKYLRTILLVLAVILVALGVFVTAKANGFDFGYDTPTTNVTGFRIPTGQYCLSDYREEGVFTTCYCPCEVECVAISSTVIESADTHEPSKPTQNTNTPEPSEPTQNADTPEPAKPTKKPKCNAGRGNGSEGDPDCDPGNSGGHNKGGD